MRAARALLCLVVVLSVGDAAAARYGARAPARLGGKKRVRLWSPTITIVPETQPQERSEPAKKQQPALRIVSFPMTKFQN